LNFLITYPSIPCIFFLVLGMAARWFTVPTDLKRTEWMLVASSLVVPAGAAAEWAATYISRWRPFKYDQFVYKLDALIGEPSFVVGRLVAQSRNLTALVGVSYGLLPTATVLTFAAYLWLRSEEETIVLVRAFMLNLFLAVPIYLLFPVCGPAFAFPGFPFVQPDLLPHAIAIAAAPNGVPSVHMSSALLILCLGKQKPMTISALITATSITGIRSSRLGTTAGDWELTCFGSPCETPLASSTIRASPDASSKSIMNRFAPG
jgi:hypothetical protein